MADTPAAGAATDFRLVVQRLDSEHGDLLDEIDEIRSEKVTIADQVMRGELSRDVLSAVSERLTTKERALEDLRLQLSLARPALAKQEEVERRHDYREMVDTLAQRFVGAVAIGQEIDARVDEIAALITRYQQGIDFSEVRGAVTDDPRLQSELDRIGDWLANGVLATLALVLRVKCAFPDRLFAGGDPIIGEERRQYANTSIEADVAASTTRLLDRARGYRGRVTAPEVDGASLARQLSGRAGGDSVDERIAGLHPATRGAQS